MNKILLLIFSFFCFGFISAQTTYDFNSGSTLSGGTGGFGIWNTQADITIGGVAYRLTSGGNGSFTNQSAGGSANSKCLRKDGAGGDVFILTRADGQPFQFYGFWVKHQSMNSYAEFMSLPPFFSINYTTPDEESETYSDNTPMQSGSLTTSSTSITNNITVTSVQINFGAIIYYWIDDINVGPAVGSAPAFTGQPSNATTCAASNTTFSVTAGNTTSYQWQVNTGSGFTNISNTSPYSGATTSTLTITGTTSAMNGYQYRCVATGSSSVNSNSASLTVPTIAATASQTNVSCNSGSNGSASIGIPTGGTAPYTYNWTPGTPAGDGTRTATGLTAGAWTVTVTDLSGCTLVKNFTIAQPPAIVAATSQRNIACNGGSSGEAAVTASGGTPPYTYSWAPAGGTAATASALSAGTYSCTITDANGCSIVKSITIAQPPAIVATTSQTNIACYGGTSGAAAVSVSGGEPPYTYSWAPAGGTAATASALSAGTYSCTITDANECSIVKSITITQPPAMVATTSQTNIACYGGTSGAAAVSVSGGEPPYTYSWAPAGGTAATASALSAGTYSCTITDANGCSIVKSFTITQPPLALPSFSEQPQDVTANSNGSAEFTVSAVNAAGFHWQVNTGEEFVDISDEEIYSGVTTATLTVTGATAAMNGYLYRCVVSSLCSSSINSNSAKLTTKSNNALLSGIEVSAGTLSPEFSSENSMYNVEVSSSTGSLKFSPETSDKNASVTVNGNPLVDGSLTVSLEGGANTITVVCTAEDGVTKQEYTVKVLRPFVSVVSLSRATGQYSNQPTCTYTLTFSGAVNDLGKENFNLSTTGALSGYSVQSVTQTARDTYNITVNTGEGDGTISLNLNNGLESDVPLSGLPYEGSEPYIVDKTKPVVKAKNVVVTLGSNGTAIISPADINDGSSDNISDAELLVYALSKSTFSSTDLGEHAITLTVTDQSGNSNEKQVNATVLKNINTITSLAPINIVYGEKLVLPETAEVSYSDLSKQDVAVNWDVVDYTGKAGTYTLQGTLDNPENTTNSEGLLARLSVKVDKRPLSVQITGTEEKTYDGNITATLDQDNYQSDKLEQDEIIFSGNASYEDKNVGSAKIITVTQITITGEAADNYTVETETAIAKIGHISPRSVEVNLKGSIEKIYDGTKSATLSIENFESTILEGDEVSFAAFAEYDDKNAGENKTVTASGFLISGKDSLNYKVTTEVAKLEGSILRKEITAKANELPLITKVYNAAVAATLIEDNYSLKGTIEGDDVLVSGYASYENGSAGKDKAITISNLALTGNDKSNYNLTGSTVYTTGEITGKSLQVRFNDNAAVTKTYDGNTIAAINGDLFQIDGIVGEDRVGLIYPSVGIYDNRHAGDNKKISVDSLSLSGDDMHNYVLASDTVSGFVGKIVPKEVSVAVDAKTKVYGAIDPALTYQINGLVGDEKLSGSLSRKLGKNVGTYEIGQGTLTGGSDYLVRDFIPGTLSVTPARLVIKAENKSRKQDTDNPVFTVTYSGLVGGDSYASLSTKPVASSSATNKSPIGYYDITVSDASSSNYDISYAKGTLTVLPSDKAAGSVQAWSPSPGTIEVRIYAETEQDAAITLYTEIGQPIVIRKKRLNAGINNVSLNSRHLASSTYVLSVMAQKFKQGERVQVK